MNLGKAIKTARIAKQISQAELAERSGLSMSYLSLLERDLRDPNLSSVQKIADGLQVPLCILVFLASDKSKIDEISPELAEKLSHVALKFIGMLA